MISGDASVEVKKFKDSSFDCIFHDPPRFALAGELYSSEFYRSFTGFSGKTEGFFTIPESQESNREKLPERDRQ